MRHELAISRGEGSYSRNTRRGGVIKHQQRRQRPRQSTTGAAAGGGRRQRTKTSHLIQTDDYVTMTLQCPSCIIVPVNRQHPYSTPVLLPRDHPHLPQVPSPLPRYYRKRCPHPHGTTMNAVPIPAITAVTVMKSNPITVVLPR